ncbi:MAG TPA: hypothetical protein VFQ35_20910 [Polyangiaceae bacterium]|nr:hypothetical protein [Polyangiaceae bacterium]
MQPCGGDVVGTWAIKDACLDTSAASSQIASTLMSGLGCTTATVQSADAKVSGSLTFNSDMSYQANVSQSTTIKLMLPSDCLKFQGITVTCDQLNQAVSSGLLTGFDSFKCGSVSGGCTCTIGFSENDTSSGTYTASGNDLTFSNSQSLGGAYCVQSNQLHMISVVMPMGSGETKILGDVVAAK